MIYFDNACTSFPKAPAVIEAVREYFLSIGSTPGRSGHRLALEAGRRVFNTREGLAQLFNISRSERIIFTSNATEALNLAILGVLKEGDHVITSCMEHNSVMRPLTHLSKRGTIALSIPPCGSDGSIDPEALEGSIQKNTRLIVVNHVSNVTGTIAPLREIKEIAKGIPLLVDAAQSAGAIPIDVDALGIDMLAFTGHKSLYGPQGTGGLFIREGIDVTPLKWGGTGSRSESWENPDFCPDRYESGTPNTPGIIGLGEGIRFILGQGIENIRNRERELTRLLVKGLEDIQEITVYGTRNLDQQAAIVSINVENMQPSEVGYRLDREFNVMTRTGLHCNPAAHKTIGTFPHGTIRLSMGCFNTTEEIDVVLEALRKIAFDSLQAKKNQKPKALSGRNKNITKSALSTAGSAREGPASHAKQAEGSIAK